MNALDGRLAVVTGGASGLGRATAQALHDAGFRVVVLDCNPLEPPKRHTQKLFATYSVDVGNDDAMERVFERIRVEFGPVQVLVNCAGIAQPGSVVRSGAAMLLSEFERVLDVNLFGTINAIRCAVPQMLEVDATRSDKQVGVIINTSSIAAFDGQVGQSAYAASKGGCAGMVIALARELGEFGIRVVGIAPGVFETPMTLSLPSSSREVVFSTTPPYPRRPGRPDEFADLVMAIIRNPMINGEVIRLDGALRMPAKL